MAIANALDIVYNKKKWKMFIKRWQKTKTKMVDSRIDCFVFEEEKKYFQFGVNFKRYDIL